MEIINVTDNANFARVKLGDIRPNRFRMLDRYPLEPEVLDQLKQSISDTGFWNNLQAVRNEQGEIELRFGHHRWQAGMDLFGPDYEVAVELVPFVSEDNLQNALAYENSVHRNKFAHCNEMVTIRREWWDNKVFEAYPTWEDAVRDECNLFGGGYDNFSIPLALEKYFGETDKNGGGAPGAYARCVIYGIGREVLLKMLPGETPSSIQQALAALPLTARAKRGLEIQQENERRKAEELRAEAQRIHEELERGRKEAEATAKARQAEQARIEAEKRAAEQERHRERSEANRKAAEDKRRAADARLAELKAQQEKADAEAQAKAQAKAEAETKARQAEFRAKQKEQVVESRAWFDARAAEVFDLPAQSAEFRRAVSNPEVRPYLDTENLLPFARAIKAKYGDALTADKIRKEVNENFREFKKTLQLKEKEIRDEKEKDNPALKLIRLMERAVTDMNRASGTLFEIEQAMKAHQFLSLQGPGADNFMDSVGKLAKRLAFYS